MIATTTVLTVLVGLLVGAVVVLSGRLVGLARKLDDVAATAHFNAEAVEMYARRPDDPDPTDGRQLARH